MNMSLALLISNETTYAVNKEYCIYLDRNCPMVFKSVLTKVSTTHTQGKTSHYQSPNKYGGFISALLRSGLCYLYS